MKPNIALTMFFACMLLVNLTAMAGDDFACSPVNVAGTWGYIETATIFDAGVGYPYASVGSCTLDAQGNLSGARTASLGGTTLRATIVGTATVNPDCTGTKTTKSYGPGLLNTADQDFVLVDNSNEIFEIFTSNINAAGKALPMIVTGQSQKTFPKGAQALD